MSRLIETLRREAAGELIEHGPDHPETERAPVCVRCGADRYCVTLPLKSIAQDRAAFWCRTCGHEWEV